MLVVNFCMLAEVDPAVVNDWFLTFYIDAYEWVVTPNVIGMGLNADGGTIATKPYICFGQLHRQDGRLLPELSLRSQAAERGRRLSV